MRRTVLLLASTTLALLACGVVFVAAVEGPAEATFAGENGKIAYRSYNRDDGGGGIYVMNPDGSGQTHVANTGGGPEVQPPGSADILPTWSPDGTKIAFARATSINDIFITNPDGSNQTNMTNTPDVYEGWPAWSPDGSRIIFVRQQLDEPDAEIYVMDTDGSNVTPVTNNGVDDFSPTWSPNGTEIAFSRINYNQDASNWEIYTMKPDGSDEINVTNSALQERTPDWSPDGMRLTYAGGNGGVSTMNADGSDQTLLVDNVATDPNPVWSPDGSKIVFSRYLGNGNSEIYTMNPDGSNEARLTNLAGLDELPDWQPLTNGNAPLDTTPPQTVIDSGPEGLTNSASATFRFHAYGGRGSTFECSLDGSTFETCTSSKLYTSLAYGSHTFRVRATDTSGNTDRTPAERTWSIENTAPTITDLLPAPNSTTTGRTPTLEAAVRDAQTELSKANITLTLDRRQITAFSYDQGTDRISYTPPKKLSKGKHTVQIVARDAEGLSATQRWIFYVVRH